MREDGLRGGALVALARPVTPASSPSAQGEEGADLYLSLLACLPDGMSHQSSVGTGTVMCPPTFRRYAKEAGFSAVEILDLAHRFFPSLR